MQAPPLVPGSTLLVRTTQGECRGTLLARRGPWLQLATDEGPLLVNAAQVVWARILAAPPAAAPQPEDAAVGEGECSDAQLRLLVEGFLDDREPRQLARQAGCTRRQLQLVRQAWECARGNLPEDGLPSAARALVPRLRRLLTA